MDTYTFTYSASEIEPSTFAVLWTPWDIPIVVAHYLSDDEGWLQDCDDVTVILIPTDGSCGLTVEVPQNLMQSTPKMAIIPPPNN